MSTKSGGLFGSPPEPVNWQGRTLGFIRRVLGQQARYPDVTAAMADTLLQPGPPPRDRPGVLCWYESEWHPHGNIALHVGDLRVLAIGTDGYPDLIGYASPILGHYLGWSERLGGDG